MIKVIYLEVWDEEASKKLEEFLYSKVGLRFRCQDLYVTMDDVAELGNGASVTDRTK